MPELEGGSWPAECNLSSYAHVALVAFIRVISPWRVMSQFDHSVHNQRTKGTWTQSVHGERVRPGGALPGGVSLGWTPVLGVTGGWVARTREGPPLGFMSLSVHTVSIHSQVVLVCMRPGLVQSPSIHGLAVLTFVSVGADWLWVCLLTHGLFAATNLVSLSLMWPLHVGGCPASARHVPKSPLSVPNVPT